jgi:hypothetical protein
MSGVLMLSDSTIPSCSGEASSLLTSSSFNAACLMTLRSVILLGYQRMRGPLPQLLVIQILQQFQMLAFLQVQVSSSSDDTISSDITASSSTPRPVQYMFQILLM